MLGRVTLLFRKLGFRVIRYFVPELENFSTNFNERQVKYEMSVLKQIEQSLGYCAPDVTLYYPMIVNKPQNIYLYENTHIWNGSTILIHSARFIMKKNSGAAQGLMVITGNHTSRVGVLFKDLINIEDVEKDVVVEEDVWIGANVTLLAGVIVGRGSIIGAGTICRKNIPPYAIVMGNPAKVVGFRFTPEQVVEHEEVLYPPEERLNLAMLEKNYQKYFLKPIERINEALKLDY